MAAANTGVQNIKTGIPDASKSSLQRDIDVLECGRGRA